MVNSFIEYFHRTQQRPDIEAILISWVLNLVTAFIVFNLSWWLTEDVFITVVYTLASWTITLSMSIAFWLSWIFNRMKTQDRIKIYIASIVLFMYTVGLYIIWSTFMYVFNLLL
jgi:hypothetical protein